MEVNSINIEWTGLFKTISGLKTDVSNRITIEREIIPIIFVPGIMGSRLQDGKKNKVWDPDGKGFMINNYGWVWVSAAERKKLLIDKQFNPDYLQVSNDDTKHNKKFADEKDTSRAERGWGGVFWSSYGELLISLQSHQWEEPARHCFEFPVHAFGYNWTDTNFNAGMKLAKEIDKIIKGYESKGRICKQVILISHSMGGLVCRSACKIHGAEKQVLGVLHGVQPATGAAAAYWRMKGGWERPHGGPNDNVWDWLRNPKKMTQHRVEGHAGAWILGTDGEEVTSILGNAPGGLELLPNKHYTNNAGKLQWLHVPGQDGTNNSFPRSGDPYEEIYRNKDDVFWRMVNPAWLDPEEDVENSEKQNVDSINQSNDRNESNDSWDSYLENLSQAEKFHNAIQVEPHAYTYQFYSSGYETVDEIRFNREELTMHLDRDPYTGIVVDRPVYPTSRGECALYLNFNGTTAKSAKEVTCKIKMEMPGEYKSGGDSTVPDSSGKALKVKRTAQIGVKARSDWFEQDHQNIYKSKKGKELVYTAVGNFALKRIEEEVSPTEKK